MKRKGNKIIVLIFIIIFIILTCYMLFWEEISGSVVSDRFLLYSISILTFFLILFSLRFSRSIFVINFFIYCLYSIYFYYGLYYQSSEGRALGWILLNLFFTGLHFIVIAGYLFFYFYKTNPNDR
jgi:hypothetical protein